MATGHGKPTAEVCPRVLVVDDEPAMIDLVRELVADRVDCDLVFASNLREARDILNRQKIDLLVADVNLPDGSGLNLLRDLEVRRPGAAALVISGATSMDGPIGALRGGAIDFLSKPFSADQLAEHIRTALQTQRGKRRREDRVTRLRGAVRKLNLARKTVNKKVDLLCNDLIHAYGELSKQFDNVRLQEGFRRSIDGARDLEQLLCHSMDWMLRQIGYCNIGIWLASAEQELQLGAYMKYTLAAEPALTEALQKNLLRIVARKGFVRLHEPDLKSVLTPAEMKFLTGQEVLGVNCTYLGECLGAILVFRDHKTPFNEDDVTALKTISPLFALALARAVKGSQDEPDDPPEEKGKGKGKSDPADWWKHGEEPPF